MVLEEVKDIIQLPSEPTKSKIDPYHIEFSAEVVHQLTDFVTSIAQMYHDNPFHCFEHARYVALIVSRVWCLPSHDPHPPGIPKKIIGAAMSP